MQTWDARQLLPQVPQLFGSVWVLTQKRSRPSFPAQMICPAGQPSDPHVRQSLVDDLLMGKQPICGPCAGQGCPAGTQILGQMVVAVTYRQQNEPTSVQALFWHCCPAGQQLPSQQLSPAAQQFVPLLPVHNVLSHGQTLHCPLQQYWPLGQQVARFVPTQAVVLLGQVARHCPLTQNWPGGQQWLASVPQQDQ